MERGEKTASRIQRQTLSLLTLQREIPLSPYGFLLAPDHLFIGFQLAVSLSSSSITSKTHLLCWSRAREEESCRAARLDAGSFTRGAASKSNTWQGRCARLGRAGFLKLCSRSVPALFRSGSEEQLLQLKLWGNSAGRSVITWVGILAENPNLFLSLNRNKCCAVTMERLRTALGPHAALKYCTGRKASHGAGSVIHHQQAALWWLPSHLVSFPFPVFQILSLMPKFSLHTEAQLSKVFSPSGGCLEPHPATGVNFYWCLSESRWLVWAETPPWPPPSVCVFGKLSCPIALGQNSAGDRSLPQVPPQHTLHGGNRARISWQVSNPQHKHRESSVHTWYRSPALHAGLLFARPVVGPTRKVEALTSSSASIQVRFQLGNRRLQGKKHHIHVVPGCESPLGFS